MPASSEPDPVPAETGRLVQEVESARAAFFEALAAVRAEVRQTPGLVGEWGERELIAHLGYWAGHAVEAIHAAEEGRAVQFGADRPSVEEVNATVARVARETDPATVRKREAASVAAFVERLGRMDPWLLSISLPYHGLTLEEAIREDGAEHYREHTEQLRLLAGNA
jgi:hypothetical protein